ncbi:MAG: secretin N-terminal domain-containing protein [Planctomycetaceae bacterium]
MLSLLLVRPNRARLVLTGLVLLLSSGIARPVCAAEFDAHRLAHVAPADARRLLLQLTGARAGELQIIADGESGTLLIRGPQDLRALAGQLLQQIDQPAPAVGPVSEDVVRAYPAPASSDTCTAIVAQWQRNWGNQIRVATDAPGTRLIVVAAPAIQEQVARTLREMTGPIALQPPSAMDREPSAVPWPATTSNSPPTRDLRLRLDAASGAHPAMPSAAAAATQTPESAGPPVSSHTFRVRAAGDVLMTLRRFFADRIQQRGPEEYVLEPADAQQLTVRFEPSGQQCLFAGPGPLVREFANLLALIDSPQSDPDQITRLMQIRRTEPQVLQKVTDVWRSLQEPSLTSSAAARTAPGVESSVRNAALQSLGINGPPAVQPVAEEARAAEPLRKPTSEVEIQSLPDLDVSILRGLGADIEELTRIINEIERLSAETTPEIEIYFLQHVRGVSLNRLIPQVLEALTGTLQGRVSITPLGKPNAVLLIGWGEAVQAAKKLLAQLDQPVEPATQVQVFRLEHAPAAQVQATVEQFLAGRTGLSPDIEITADPRTNSLIVHAAPRDLGEVELLIRQLDVGKSQAVNQGRVIRLRNTLAADVAQTLQAAVEAARGGGAGQNAGRNAVLQMLLVDPEGQRVVTSGLLNDVRVTPDPRTNALIITGPEQSMELIEALIRELDETPASAAQIKVFQVINGDATEMVLMLRSLFPAQAGSSSVPQLPSAEGESSLVPVRFSVDTRTNSIIATGSASDLRIIEALLARLDAEEAQQRINRVYRLRNSPAIDVAVAVNEFLRNEQIVQRAAPGRPNPFQQIESEVVVVAEPVGNTLIISASPRFFEEILELVKNLDEQPPQVLVQVIIAEVDLSHFHELGVELGLQDSLLFDRSLLGDLITTTSTVTESTPAGVVTSTNQLIQAASLTPGFNFNNLPLGNSGSDKSLATSGNVAGQTLSHFNLGRMSSELGYGGLVLSASSENVSMLVRALDQSRHVEILSRPQIMTLDNQPAFIQVGQRVPRIVATSINTIGQVNTVELEDVGLILGITPRISPDGMVVMEVDAEKSEVGPEIEGIPISVSAEGEIVRSPRVDITRAQTTVSAISGQTIVLGGLITKDHMSTSRKVPWLGDIPLLGALFRYDSHMNDRKELLIIMTPHVIRGPDDADYHKQVEMARMSWCTADVYELLSPGSPLPIQSRQYDESGVPVIFPDQTPGLEWKLDRPADSLDNNPPSVPSPEPAPLQPIATRRNPDRLLTPGNGSGEPSPGNSAADQPGNDSAPVPDPGPVRQLLYAVPANDGLQQSARDKPDEAPGAGRRWWQFQKTRKEDSGQ